MTDFHKAAIALLEHLATDGHRKRISTNASFAQTLDVKQGPLALATLDLFRGGAFDVTDPQSLPTIANLPWGDVWLNSFAGEVLRLHAFEPITVPELRHPLMVAERHANLTSVDIYSRFLNRLFMCGAEVKITTEGYKQLGGFKKAMSNDKQNTIQNIGNNNTNVIGDGNRVTNASHKGLDAQKALELLDKVLSLVESNAGDEHAKDLVRTDAAILRTELKRDKPIFERIRTFWNTLMQTTSGLAAIPGLAEVLVARAAALGVSA